MSNPVEPNQPTPARRHGSGLIWIAVIGVLVFLQWPTIKGWYYKASGAPAPADGIGWRTDFDAALAESAKTHRPVLIDFSARWCPPCQVMKHDVWPDPEVAALAREKYVPMLVDVDDAKLADVVRRYGIESIPTVVVVDHDGKVLARANFMSKNGTLEFLKKNAGGG